MAELSLEVVEGPDAGRMIPIRGTVQVGRDPGSDLVLRDDQVSRRHLRIAPTAGGVLVEDVGSRNGTFVNDNLLHAPTVASPGDQILAGLTVIQVRSAEQVARQPSAVRPVPPALAVPPQEPDYVPPDLRGPPSPQGPRVEVEIPDLDPLLDVHTKRRALLAPVAILVLVTLAVLLWLAAR